MARFDPPQRFPVETLVFLLTTAQQVLWIWRAGAGHHLLMVRLNGDGILVQSWAARSILLSVPAATDDLVQRHPNGVEPVARILAKQLLNDVDVHGIYGSFAEAVSAMREDTELVGHVRRGR